MISQIESIARADSILACHENLESVDLRQGLAVDASFEADGTVSSTLVTETDEYQRHSPPQMQCMISLFKRGPLNFNFRFDNHYFDILQCVARGTDILITIANADLHDLYREIKRHFEPHVEAVN